MFAAGVHLDNLMSVLSVVATLHFARRQVLDIRIPGVDMLT